MRTSKFTEEQMAYALKQAELGISVEEVCRKMGISSATFYKWRQKYAGVGPSELRRMRAVGLDADLGVSAAMDIRLFCTCTLCSPFSKRSASKPAFADIAVLGRCPRRSVA